MESDTTVELNRETLKQLLEMYIDATDLLEEIPKMMDQGRLNEVSQHIGAELEARVTELNKAEKTDHVIRELLEEVSNDQAQQQAETLEDLEDEILGD